MLNLSAAFLLQLTVVVPLSLFVLVVQNWVLGSAVCYLLPMMQVSEKGPVFFQLMPKPRKDESCDQRSERERPNG